jgi:SAM-dependent methyltransferase
VITQFPCPVCSGTQWREHDKFVYALSDHQQSYSVLRAAGRLAGRFAELIAFGRRRRTVLRNINLSRYHRLRRRVLFERWFPGAQEITLTSIYCEGCGFMSYRPRPRREDLVAKYRFLGAEDRPHPQFTSAAALTLDRRRADWVRAALQPSLPPRRQLKVLDYGGGDGKLMQPFLEQGHECCLLDYSEQQIPGVMRIGAELEDLPPGRVFDVIIASHVLEHVPQPREDLGKLREHLAADGVIYCEVPSEILGGLWIDNDPVTHINFFTLHSFRRLLQESTLGIVRSGQRVGNYGRSYRDTLWAVASRTPMAAQPVSASDISNYLYPPRSATVKLLTELLWKSAAARLMR